MYIWVVISYQNWSKKSQMYRKNPSKCHFSGYQTLSMNFVSMTTVWGSKFDSFYNSFQRPSYSIWKRIWRLLPKNCQFCFPILYVRYYYTLYLDPNVLNYTLFQFIRLPPYHRRDRIILFEGRHDILDLNIALGFCKVVVGYLLHMLMRTKHPWKTETIE